MSADPNKKSGRTFQCRDVLWETFEQMARELECSVDYLINEAMKQYARQRSYGAIRTPNAPIPGRGTTDFPPASDPASPLPVTSAPLSGSVRPPPLGSGLPPPPGAPLAGALRLPPAPPGRPAPLPPPPVTAARAAAAPMHSLPGLRAPVGMPPLPRSVPPPAPSPGPRSVPPPLPRGPSPGTPNGFPVPAAPTTTLSLIYQGERHSVTKDRFVIGRGKQSSDLTLKDPNVSRQHAMVEFQNGVYFMVDMGSTNGVEFNGQRIARKQIGEGDVFRICDHDIFFTYR